VDHLIYARVAQVTIFPDNDDDGRKYAANVARSCMAAGLQVRIVELPDLPEKGDLTDFLNTNLPEALLNIIQATPWLDATPEEQSYAQTIREFLSEEDVPATYIIEELLPDGQIMIIHGEPRARKSLVLAEIVLSAVTATPAFGLARFTPKKKVNVMYIQEEDPRGDTRRRLRRLIEDRCGSEIPDNLVVSVRRGVNLDDPEMVDRIIRDLKAQGARLLALDAARRLSAKTDEGPAKVRELTAVLRRIVTEAGVSIALVHHDVKPTREGRDQRREGQRISGGDWFAACECPVYVEKVSGIASIIKPGDYKFTADPAPFSMTALIDNDKLVYRLAGADMSLEDAERAGARGKILDFLKANPKATKKDMKTAGICKWTVLGPLLEDMEEKGQIVSEPGRAKNSKLYSVAP